MPSGSAVIRRAGKRGVVFYVKFVDAGGRQVKERLGREVDGWTERKARAELEARLTDVRREGMRKPRALILSTFADEWLATYPDAKGLKRSTRESYKTIIDRHLKPALGHLRLEAVDVAQMERYLAAKRREGLQPRTLNRQLNLLNLILAAAVRQQLVRLNPVGAIDRPREPRRRWTILSPVEVGRIERAFLELDQKQAWREQARLVFLTVVGAGLRRGEILGLRWRDVELADPAGAILRVRETFVRGAEDTPKSGGGGEDDRTRAEAGRGALAASPPHRLLRRRRAGVLSPDQGLAARSQALRQDAASGYGQGRS